MDSVTLVQENRRLKQLVARYREQVRRLSTRNQSLLRTVNELAREEEILDDEDHDVPMEENDEENQGVANWQNEDEDEGEDVNSNRPIWDSNDCVLRCRDCSWEVLDGMCQHPGCLKEHDIPDASDFSNSQEEEATFFDGITSTLSAAELAERVLASRGETPPPSVDIRQGDIPPQYSFSPAQRESYQELRQRGATHQMCTTFSMRFKKEVGIIAVLTPEIKETFAGPTMLPEHEWELWLGREVRVDPDDEDGSDFIIGLLEDVLLFSGNHFTRRSLMWETVRTVNLLQATVWITRPTGTLLAAFGSPALRERADTESSVDSTSDEDERARDPADRLLKKPFAESGPTIHRDEYELTDVEALETDDDGDDDVADPGYGMNPRYDDFNWSDGEDDGLYGSEDEREVADAERFAHADVSQAEGDVQMKIEEDEAAGRITGSSLAGLSHVSQTVVASNAETQDDEELDSPVESDFDEDEVLSGDEDVLQGIGRGSPPAV